MARAAACAYWNVGGAQRLWQSLHCCRQVEGQKHDLLDLETKSQGHGDSQEHLAMQLAKIQGAQASTGSEVTQVTNMDAWTIRCGAQVQITVVIVWPGIPYSNLCDVYPAHQQAGTVTNPQSSLKQIGSCCSNYLGSVIT